MKTSAILLSCLVTAFAFMLLVELTQDQPIFNQITGNKSQVRGTSFSYSLSSLLSSSNPLRNPSFKKQVEKVSRKLSQEEVLDQETGERQLKASKFEHDPEYRNLDESEGSRQLKVHKVEDHDPDYRALGGHKFNDHPPDYRALSGHKFNDNPPDYRQLMSDKIRQLGNHRYENAHPVYEDKNRKLGNHRYENAHPVYEDRNRKLEDTQNHHPTHYGYAHDNNHDRKLQDLVRSEETEGPEERMSSQWIPGQKVYSHVSEDGNGALGDGEGLTGMEKMFMSSEAQRKTEMDKQEFVLAERDGQRNLVTRSKAPFGNKFDRRPVKTVPRETSAKMVDSGTAY